MKILITGSKGQLGADCAQVLGATHETLAIDLDELDITNQSDVERITRNFSPHIVVNCAAYTQVDACETEKDLAWITQQAAAFPVRVEPRHDLGMVAVQGPNARAMASTLLPDGLREAAMALKPFSAAHDETWFVGRTGYTGEDGFEIIIPEHQAVALWQGLANAGVQPCGLGARDTLRLEAGMNLYGNDMDESQSPLVSGLAWTVAWQPEDRDFIGRSALEKQKAAGNLPTFIGLVLQGRGVLRSHQKLFAGDSEVGEITSGGFSPTLERSIAMARVDSGAGAALDVDIRGRRIPVARVKMPFARNGAAVVDLTGI